MDSDAPGAKRPRPAGVGGEVGASYTVYATAWNCPDCSAENFPSRERCFKCKCPRPSSASPAAAIEDAENSQTPSNWREAFDPRTKQLYYYNMQTRETSWARPAEMGPAPYATGFFGRGAAGSTAQADLEAKIKLWLQRPARKQAEFELNKMQRAEGANEYNIWYGKYIGDHWTGGLGKDPAPTRCDPDHDCGWTKASRTTGATQERAYFCIHFARGACAKGPDCTFYHHIPTAADDGAWDSLHDCFGRERHQTHREDMAGVGSFGSDCRTLYVGGIKKTAAKTVEQLEALVRTSFEAWGELENLNFIPRLSIAFVRYRCRLSAEFALTAMGNQSLGHGEILNVRWAHDDPNPVAKESRVRADADAVAAALIARGVTVDPTLGLPLFPGIDHASLLLQDDDGQQGRQDEDVAGESDHPSTAGVPASSTSSVPPPTDATVLAPPAPQRQAYATQSSSTGFSGSDAAAFLAEAMPPPLSDYSAVPQSSGAAMTGARLSMPPAAPAEASDTHGPTYARWYYHTYMPWAQAQAAAVAARSALAESSAASRQASSDPLSSMVVGGASNPYLQHEQQRKRAREGEENSTREAGST